LTPKQFKEARKRLGLSVSQMAAALGVGDVQIRRMQVDADKESHRPVMPTTEKLIRAYLDGYRPRDWPAQEGKN
jgi:transcriptional regulator with XRE-family HTH domain